MNKECPQINHQYDVWHLSKWVVKPLTSKAQHLLKCHDWDVVYRCKDVYGKLDLLSTNIKSMFDECFLSIPVRMSNRDPRFFSPLVEHLPKQKQKLIRCNSKDPSQFDSDSNFTRKNY